MFTPCFTSIFKADFTMLCCVYITDPPKSLATLAILLSLPYFGFGLLFTCLLVLFIFVLPIVWAGFKSIALVFYFWFMLAFFIFPICSIYRIFNAYFRPCSIFVRFSLYSSFSRIFVCFGDKIFFLGFSCGLVFGDGCDFFYFDVDETTKVYRSFLPIIIDVNYTPPMLFFAERQHTIYFLLLIFTHNKNIIFLH